MESNSSAARILCSQTSYTLLCEQAPEIPVRRRGKIAVKGKGDMLVYWVGETRGPKARFACPPPLDEFAMETMSDSHSSFNDVHHPPLRHYLKGELTKMDQPSGVKFADDVATNETQEQAPTPNVACV